MRIVFLHLSDLHIQNMTSVDLQKVQSAVDHLSKFAPFEGVLLIISGDIANSGITNEYKCASKLIGSFFDLLQKTYTVSPNAIKLLLIPGNHDINWGKGRSYTPETIRNFDDITREKEYGSELKRMHEFFSFSSKNNCFFAGNSVPLGKTVTRKILPFSGEYYIEANLVNTAPFSCDEDDGLHYLPEEAFLELDKPSKANLSIVIMHHSPDWFTFHQKKRLQQIIARRCSIAFFGHEHILGAQQVVSDNGRRVIRQEGGAWFQSATPFECEYYAAVFETESRNYTLFKYRWNATKQGFASCMSQEINLKPKAVDGSGLVYRDEYITELMRDDKYTISQSIADYFVFPDLLIDSSGEYSRNKRLSKMGDFISFVEENRYIAITGGSNAGKTTLLKVLLAELCKTKYVLFCGTKDISGRNQANIISELVSETFGNDSLEQFYALKKEQRVVIIDDLHRIRDAHIKKFLLGLEELFGTIIVASSEMSQYDIIQYVKDQLNVDDEFRKVRISSLLAEKRLELIEKIVHLKIEDNAQVSETVRNLETSLNSYKLDFRTQIDFVVQFTSYYCEHYDELVKADASVFSKVFEASIERLIAPYLTRKNECKEDIIVAISEVAFYIHFNKAYPISGDNISGVIRDYCDYYDNKYLTPERFLVIAESSGILKKTSCGYTYRFTDKNYLAYFVAKALNRKYHDDGNDSFLRIVVEESCFGINGEILSFLTFISDNVRIPRLILRQAQSFIQDWPEFSLAEKQKYLQVVQKQLLEAPKDNQKRQDLEKRTEIEAAMVENSNIETLDIYDYDVSTINELGNQLLRAGLQLKTVSRNFAAFISILPAMDKRAYAEALYTIPNKIFNRWACYIDENIDDLIGALMEWQESDSFTGKKKTKEQFRQIFQEASINLLLNLYYSVAVYGVNNNTVGYLISHESADKTLNHQIEKVLYLEKVDDIIPALQLVEKIHKETKDAMVKNICSIILAHMYINSVKLPAKERRRIASQYFAPQNKANLLLNRMQNQNEK